MERKHDMGGGDSRGIRNDGVYGCGKTAISSAQATLSPDDNTGALNVRYTDTTYPSGGLSAPLILIHISNLLWEKQTSSRNDQMANTR